MYSHPQIADPVVIIPPSQEPITLTEAKLHLGEDQSARDAEITSLITASRQRVEKLTGLYLVDQTLELRLDGYPTSGAINLRGPLLGSATFYYTDADGDLQTLAADQYLTESSLRNRYPRIVQPYAVTWPYSIPVSDAVRIQWRAGFVDLTGSPTESMTLIPGPLLTAIKLHMEAFYDRDEKMMKILLDAVESICGNYRVDFGVA